MRGVLGPRPFNITHKEITMERVKAFLRQHEDIIIAFLELRSKIETKELKVTRTFIKDLPLNCSKYEYTVTFDEELYLNSVSLAFEVISKTVTYNDPLTIFAPPKKKQEGLITNLTLVKDGVRHNPLLKDKSSTFESFFSKNLNNITVELIGTFESLLTSEVKRELDRMNTKINRNSMYGSHVKS